MRSFLVVMSHVAPKDSLEVPPSQDQGVIETLGSYGSNEAFGESVGSRGPYRSWDDPDALGSEDLVEGTGELGVSVSDEEPHGIDPLA